MAIALKLRHYLDSLHLITRRHEIGLEHFASAPGEVSTRHCLILHGWASDARAMRQVREYLQNSPAAAKWNFWDISYDTTWQSFSESARQISDALQKTEHDFQQTIIIGYSMGGLVARQLVAEGFPCGQLVTLCTPHHGPVRWMPVPTRGPRSLANWSRHARALDRDPRDVAHRKRYHFFAVTYRDTFGFHRHDGMVPQSSALGCKLSGIKTRRIIKLKYSVPVSILMPVDPHWRGMFPKYISPALDHIQELMRT